MNRCTVIIGRLAPHPCGAKNTTPCSSCGMAACSAHMQGGICDHCRTGEARSAMALTWEEMWAFDDNAHLFEREVTVVSSLRSYDS